MRDGEFIGGMPTRTRDELALREERHVALIDDTLARVISGKEDGTQSGGGQEPFSITSSCSNGVTVLDGPRDAEDSFCVKSSNEPTEDSRDESRIGSTTGFLEWSGSARSKLRTSLAEEAAVHFTTGGVPSEGEATGGERGRKKPSGCQPLTPLRVPPCQTSVIRTEDVVKIVAVFLDEATHQPHRSFLSFVGTGATVPSAEEYRLRMCVNLLYYARNYINCVAMVAVVACLWYPCFLLMLLLTAVTRVMVRVLTQPRRVSAAAAARQAPPDTHKPPTSTRVHLFRILQFIACVLLLNYVGFRAFFGFIVSFTVPVGAHAFLTPFTDAAYANYVAVMQKHDIPVAAPRSPTKDLSSVDPSFEAAFLSHGAGVEVLAQLSE